MKKHLNADEILKSLHSEFDNLDPDLINGQISAVEKYLDLWTERTEDIKRNLNIPHIKHAMESSGNDWIIDGVILYVLLRDGYLIGKACKSFHPNPYCANLKFNEAATKDAQSMKKSGAFKIYPQKFEKNVLEGSQERLDS
jgi:hypothetical protein